MAYGKNHVAGFITFKEKGSADARSCRSAEQGDFLQPWQIAALEKFIAASRDENERGKGHLPASDFI